MKETKEVKELRSKILGMEMELCIVHKDLERFENELLYNKRLLDNIVENINFLKSGNVAVSLTEYKKIKQQKKLIKTRIDYYNSKVIPLKQKIAIKENNYKEEMKRFEHIYRLQFENNVLEFKNVRRKKTKNN